MGVFYVSGTESVLTVGRDPGADLVLDRSYVSRRHLIFRRMTDDVAAVEVLGTNGAGIREKQVNKGYSGLVRAGDCVSIGDIRIVWTGRRSTHDQLFFGLNTQVPAFEDCSVEIEGPPPRRVPEKPSVMLAAGPALTMAIPILLGAGRTVAVLSSVFAAVWAVANVLTRVQKQRADESRRRNTYLSYISECEMLIKSRIANIRAALNGINPSIDAYLQPDAASLLWKGISGDQDKLPVRTGMGTIKNPLNIVTPRERFAGIDDSLKALPGMIRRKYETIPACPVLIDLYDLPLAGFAINGEADRQRLSAFILNLCAAYSPERLCIKLNAKKDLMLYLMWVTWLPHYREGSENKDKVVITDEANVAANAVSGGARAVLIFYRDGKAVPASLKVINRDRQMKEMKYDEVPQQLCYSYALAMSRIRGLAQKSEEIPAAVMFGRLIDDLLGNRPPDASGEEMIRKLAGEVRKQYTLGDTTVNISAPVGIKEGGEKVFLDIHEKGSGPHGLIAGTTGSGKSELLTTVIISFALRYPPEKLSFILIDYKGGGMSGLFADLPHLLGSISNLTRSMSQRAMTALKSENIRRQELFAKCGVNNINDYTLMYDRKEVTEPLPHIVIIVDEFAELRSQESEFMDNLISISQVGRSLGMHLLLATQKPAGVVDDKIRSNTGFRIALRLVDRADSMDMLHRDDATSIKECGRAYLQTANDDLVCFQSGYAMAPVASDEKAPRIYTDFYMDEELTAVLNDDEDAAKETMSWYELTLEAVKLADKARGSVPVSRIWLPPVPGEPDDDEAYAIYDDPGRQRYIRAIYDPYEAGHTLVAGRSASGKSELLHTIICRLASPAAIYIIDMGGGRLKDAALWPCCGAYIGEDGCDNMLRLTGFIDNILQERRKDTDRKQNTILLVLDNIEEIRKSAPDAGGHISHILTLGKSVGIFILASTGSLTGSKEERLFDTCLFLGNDDPYVISCAFHVPVRAVIAIADCPGRGIGIVGKELLEFQAIKTGDAANRPPPCDVLAKPYPYVPPDPIPEDFIIRAVSEIPPGKGGDIPDSFPAGYERESGRIFAIPLKDVRCVLLGGKAYSGRHSFLSTISSTAERYGITCVKADTYETYISYCRQSTDFKIIIAENISDILEGFYEKTRSPDEEEELISCLENPVAETARKDITKLTVAIVDEEIRNRYFGRPVYEALTGHPYVLMFGGHLDESRIFDFSYMSFSRQQKSQTRGNATVLKYTENTFSGDVILPLERNVDNSQTL